MQHRWSRRGFLQFAAAGGVATTLGATVAGCSRHSGPVDDHSDGAVTITHVFGRTVIPRPPSRVVSAGFTEQDDLLAVGVVPVAVTAWFGDQPFGVWPWAQSRLGGAQPTVLNADNGIAVDRIEALKPDLIVAINAGLDAETYQKLSAIAPTVAQSDGDAFFEPWKKQAETIGQCVSQSDQMSARIDGVDKKFADVAAAHPNWGSKAAVLLQGTLWQDSIVAVPEGWRTDFLTRMGLTLCPNVAPFASGQHAAVPRDRFAEVLDSADVVIWMTESPEQQSAILADRGVAASRATRQNRNVFTTKELAGAIAFASPLSYPVVADELPPLIGNVLR